MCQKSPDQIPVLLLDFKEHEAGPRDPRLRFGPLAAAGFSVWAPDMRGFNLSDRPAGREAYRLRHLVADVAALVRATGHPRAHLVGHDWGGIVAWTFAGEHPELLGKLVILNAPHLKIYFREVRRPPQMLRSLYVPFFRLPVLPERLLSACHFLSVRLMFKLTPARKGAFSDDDIAAYVAALSEPGALTAGLNYYRANLTVEAFTHPPEAPIDAQTLVIWGERDPALGTRLLEGLDRIAPRLRVHRIPDAGHWVQNEAPEEVNRVLLDFLKG